MEVQLKRDPVFLFLNLEKVYILGYSLLALFLFSGLLCFPRYIVSYEGLFLGSCSGCFSSE